MKAASLFTTPAVVAHAHAQLVAWQRRPHRPINRPTDQPCSRGGTDGRGGGTHGDILSRPSGRPSVCPFFHPWSEVASPLLLSAAVKTGASERAASFVVVVQRRRCPRQKRPFKRSHCAPLQSSHAHAHEEGPRDHQGDRSPWPACLPARLSERANGLTSKQCRS